MLSTRSNRLICGVSPAAKSLIAALVLAPTASCWLGDSALGPDGQVAQLTLVPTFSTQARNSLAGVGSLGFIVRRTDGSLVVADTVPVGIENRRVEYPIEVTYTPPMETFTMEFVLLDSNGDELFTGGPVEYTISDDEPSPSPLEVPVVYVGATGIVRGSVSVGGTGLDGVTVSLVGDLLSLTTTTAGGGAYTFLDVWAPGDYTVAISDLGEFFFAEASKSVSLGATQTAVVDFVGTSLARVCEGEYATVQEAYDATIPGGMIEICDGTHSVEGVVLDAPVTIQAVAGANPVLQTSTALSTVFLDGYTSGTVLIDGLTFDFTTPTGGTFATRSYAIRGTGTYDQLIVRNSTFNIGPVSRGSVLFFNNTVTGSEALVENSTFNGGVFGVAVFQAGPDPRLDVLNSQFSGNRLLYSAASGRVEGSTFENCGSGSCVSVSSGSSGVEVVSNTFAAPALTGDVGPDLNQVVRFTASTTGLIDNNIFEGCGFFECVFAAGVVTISNNEFTHVVPALGEFEFAAVISSFEGVDVTVANNTIHSCASFACYKIGDGTTITIRNETIGVPNGHGTQQVLNAGRNPEWTGVGNTIVFEDNVMTGSGVGNLADPATYPAQLGLGVYFGQVTANRNSFVQVGTGVDVGPEGTLIGRDNTFAQMVTAVGFVDAAATVDFRFNDFTGQITDIGFAGIGTNLTCNWWGNIAGPQNIEPSIPVAVYTPWATAPIANGAGGLCDGMAAPAPTAVRVDPDFAGTEPDIVATLQEAIALVATGGTITVADGIHPAPGGLHIDRPMTLTADPLTLPIVDGEGACFVAEINGVGAGLVTIRSLRFVNSSCNALAVQNVYDQVIIEDSQFEAPGLTVSGSVVGGSGVVVRNNLFVGTDMLINTGANGLIQGNTFSNCAGPAEACLTVTEGGAVSVIGNTMTIDISNPLSAGITTNGGLLVIEGNSITGIGRNTGAPPGPLQFPIQLAGIDVQNGTVVTSLSNNTIMNAFRGLRFNDNAMATGTDNVIEDVEVGIQAFGPLNTITISSSDFTNYVTPMDVEFANPVPILTCNWWGFDTGPVAPEVPDASLYTPWATVPIANEPAVVCPP